LASTTPLRTLQAMNTLHPAEKKTQVQVSIGLCWRKMWRGRISFFPITELFRTFFLHCIFAICSHRFRVFSVRRHQVNLATHLFVRICEGNCKKTRTKYRVSTKLADLMRISSHLFFSKNSHICMISESLKVPYLHRCTNIHQTLPLVAWNHLRPHI